MLLEKLYSTLILAAMFATGAMAQSESALITKPAEGTTVTFPPTSYIGIDTTTACYMYASSAVMGKGVDDDRSTNIFDTYRYALINAWDKRPAAPLPPKLTAFQAYDPNPWGGPGGLQFTLSYYSSDFN